MTVSETWGIPIERIESFFSGQEDVLRTGDKRYIYKECGICLTRLPDRELGGIRVPQTLIEFSGRENDTQEIRKRFFLRFISAGA